VTSGDLNAVLEEARRLVEPKGEEAVREVSEEFKRYIASRIEEAGVRGEVALVGSAARGTWLPDKIDIDLFIILSRDYPKEFINNLLSIIRKFLDKDNISYELRYAEHPYITAHYKGFDIDIVPCFKIAPGEAPITAADRSPLHHQYLLARLDDERRLSVRLLKRFMRGIGVYGAEVRVEGFSGYLTELLVVRYGSFLDVLKAAARWRPYKTVIDIEGYYKPQEALKKFKSPLVVVDPVDKNRNAAAAVSLTSMSTFILAAKMFLRRPSLSYFEPRRTPALAVPTIALVFPWPGGAPDAAWGRLKRIARALANKVEECGFKVLRWGVGGEEGREARVVLLLESYELPQWELHVGPPAASDAAEAFVEKYLGEEVVGPFVEGGRVYVVRRRKITRVEDCLAKTARDLGLRFDIAIGVGTDLASKTPWLT
jgi:tRNA nucleotidyltransferase (CCA-adding enzyme)